METGIYTNIGHSEYHAMRDRVSNSYLSRLDKCPALVHVPQEATPALTLGRAFHALALEGETAFNAEFAIAPECDRRTKSGKDIWSVFESTNPGKTILSAEDGIRIYGMVESLMKHPFAVKLLAEGRSEVTVLWTDPTTGIDCRCRPDRVPSGNKGVIADLKSVSDASEKAFLNAVLKYGWHREAGMYIEGWNAVTNSNGKVDAFPFIACEKEPPYRVEVYVLDDDFVNFGKSEFHRLLNVEKKCREDKFYPHYINAGAIEITMPHWLDWGRF